MRRTPLLRLGIGLGVALVSVALLAACNDGAGGAGGSGETDEVGLIETPELGACRVLTADDVAAPSNASETVDCAEDHTAQTYAVGPLPERLADVEYDDDALGAWAYETCSSAFMKFLGADESVVMRTVLSWAWFRPSEEAWDQGARWYRCDLVGGTEDTAEFVTLPEDARGLLQGLPADDWMVCAAGETVADSPKVPCTEDHDWRAVTTIKLGEPAEDYPGDRVVEVRTQEYCSRSVGAWLGYPPDYKYGYTYFQQAEWELGNRRSVCWAMTEK